MKGQEFQKGIWRDVTARAFLIFLSILFAAVFLQGAVTNALQVVALPATNKVFIDAFPKTFKLTLLVENRSPKPQTIRVMDCNWQDSWWVSSENLALLGSDCQKNSAVDISIPSGGTYTNVAELMVTSPVPPNTFSFYMAFTQIGTETTIRSDYITVNLVPPRLETVVITNTSSNTGLRLLDGLVGLIKNEAALATTAQPVTSNDTALSALPDVRKAANGRHVLIIAEYQGWFWCGFDPRISGFYDDKFPGDAVFRAVDGLAIKKGSRNIVYWSMW